MNSNPKKTNRRNFLQSSTLAGVFLGISPTAWSSKNTDPLRDQLEKALRPTGAQGTSVMGLRVPPIEQLKVAIIGLGNRGSGHVELMVSLHPKAKITAICDLQEEKAKQSADFLRAEGQTPAVYSGNPEAWKEMVQRDDIDLVIIATPWEEHTPMGVYAMQQGKHVGIEVPVALTLEDCWKLVDTAEETQRNCMMLENTCYGEEELWVLNMVNAGVFGTLTYAEAAYIHNLTEGLFSDKYYNKWRIRHHQASDANLYPTHGLGPVAQYLGIGRGDRFDHLVAMSSLEASLTAHARTIDKTNEFYNRSDFAHGDMNNALIKTHQARTVLLQHDVVTPRPYSRINALAGTQAYHEGYPSRLAIQGKQEHDWLPEAAYQEMREKFKHPIWETLKEKTEQNQFHGGMDYVMAYRLIDNLNRGLPLDMDVYDAVDWSVVTPLSATSIQLGSVPVKFPDFTRGQWKEKRVLEILKS